jgi:hypothetical protein
MSFLSTPIRWSLASIALFAVLSAPAIARADDGGTPCGNFNFASGISCKIEVSGGCMADCTTLKFEAGCSGGCSVTANQTCVNDCGTKCVAMCDPAALDCFTGCHGECDQPTTAECMQKQPSADCVTQAKAQCDVHCKDACQVPPTNCQEHCTKCCTGSCTTQVNFDCDFQCFASLQGGCTAQCTAPQGAIFCNGQYVHASDVQACVTYLATQGINVDVSARGSATCDLNGCKGVGSASGAGCMMSPGSNAGLFGGVAWGAIACVMARIRRRKGK